MLKVLLVDDEPLALANLQRIVEGFEDVEVIGSTGSSTTALHIAKRQRPDVILVDIEMPGINGVNFAREIKARIPVQIIFVTAYNQYAVDAFDAVALDYVLKPVDPERLAASLDRARTQALVGPILEAIDQRAATLKGPLTDRPEPEAETVYWAPTDGGLVRILHEDIDHIEACRDYAYIHTRSKKYMVRETMTALEGSFAGSALRRIHRSHIVNLNRIQVIQSTAGRRVVLSSGTALPVGCKYYDQLRAGLAPTPSTATPSQ
jgi:two-component system, LytTR family, response regulator